LLIDRERSSLHHSIFEVKTVNNYFKNITSFSMEKYKLKLIGYGGQGVVFLATDNSTGEIVCLKKVILENVDSKEAEKEANLLNKLKDHPNIVHMKEYFVDYNYFCIVMEYVDGDNLKKKIDEQIKANRTPFEETFILHVLTQLSSALLECRKQKIIHRDVKPNNIFLTKEGQVKLGDFGVGNSVTQTNKSLNTFASTQSYMAPEVINDHPSYSFPADIWSLGCVIYKLMSLSSPFHVKSVFDLPFVIKEGKYPPLKGNYSQELKWAVEGMLKVDLKERLSIEKICEFSFLELSKISIDKPITKEEELLIKNQHVKEKINELSQVINGFKQTNKQLQENKKEFEKNDNEMKKSNTIFKQKLTELEKKSKQYQDKIKQLKKPNKTLEERNKELEEKNKQRKKSKGEILERAKEHEKYLEQVKKINKEFGEHLDQIDDKIKI
jgi:NIMA (never in mitosis gene a)-related kinase